MNVIIYTYAILVIVSGLFNVAVLFLYSVLNENVLFVGYPDISENETEFAIRTALIKYPKSNIEAPKNQISCKLSCDNPRVTTRQEI